MLGVGRKQKNNNDCKKDPNYQCMTAPCCIFSSSTNFAAIKIIFTKSPRSKLEVVPGQHRPALARRSQQGLGASLSLRSLARSTTRYESKPRAQGGQAGGPWQALARIRRSWDPGASWRSLASTSYEEVLLGPGNKLGGVPGQH